MTAISAITPHNGQIAYFQGASAEALQLCVWQDADVRTVAGDLRCTDHHHRLVWDDARNALYYAAADDTWHHNIYQADLSTGAVTPLTNYYRVQSAPLALHPSGAVLLLVSDLRGELNLRLHDFETGALRKITDYATPVGPAVYHPQGTHIAYTANGTYNPYNRDIYLMDGDGFGKQRLLSTLAGAADTVHDWSADGGFLAVSSNFDGVTQVGVLSLQHRTLRWLSPDSEDYRVIGFAPDGAHLLTATSGELVVYGMADGLPVTRIPGAYSGTAWETAERLLLGTTNGDLYRYHLSSGHRENLL
jgi:WD40 repeat protein